jgi:hypothetical protein
MTAGSLVGLRSVQVGADIDEETVLLVHSDGYDAGTTITDFSATGHTITVNGGAAVDTAQSKFGGASIVLDGTGDYLSIPDSTDFDFGTGDFTVEFWLRLNASLGSYVGFISASNSGSADDTWFFGYYSGAVNFGNGRGTQATESWSPSTGTWYHLAVSRSGDSLRMFIDGELVDTFSAAGQTYNCGSSGMVVGRLYTGPYDNYYVNGWMDEIRISKGIGRYTETFTVATKEYGA